LESLRPRAVSQLRLLALDHGEPVHRERLIDLLWPDANLPVGLRRLQVAVSSVRQLFVPLGTDPGEIVRRSGDNYVLRLPGTDVDVHRFEQLLARADGEPDRGRRSDLRQRALDLYVGDLLPEAGSAEYVISERDRLRMRAAAAAQALAGDQLAAGRAGAAAATSRRSLELNRYSDLAWRALVDALDATGDDTAATRARLEHRAVLADLERGLAVTG
jgi:DNA-binding SARP family transcriptional activator